MRQFVWQCLFWWHMASTRWLLVQSFRPPPSLPVVVLTRGGGGDHSDDVSDIDIDMDDDDIVTVKSNAVGDGGGDDDSDDPSDSEFLDDTNNNINIHDVQVEVEYVPESKRPSSGGGGGVGVKFGRSSSGGKSTKNNNKQTKTIEQHLLTAWKGLVFLPYSSPPVSLFSKQLHGDSKLRLDRRTLYGLLLQELTDNTTTTSSSRSHCRPFLDATTKHQLQAALSMASQPTWRTKSPRRNAVVLQTDTTALTLNMQETICLALAHSMQAGMVILDDNVLESVQKKLLSLGYSEHDMSSPALIQSILALAKQGALSSNKNNLPSAKLSQCMETDLELGLEDPFDERALSSIVEMKACEQECAKQEQQESSVQQDMPLIVFVRTQRSKNLLKNKAVVDVLLGEANSSESRNLLVLGKGIDITTTDLPELPDEATDAAQNNNNAVTPFMGFAPNYQSATGQNDPEGSRRFNIFLARTTDASGRLGILGAVAPPEAGNLFPHMFAMQARMHAEQHEEDSPAREQLEAMAQQMQSEMQLNPNAPLPQFFNASLSHSSPTAADEPPPSPEMIQQTLEGAMSELLDRLAQLNEEGAAPDMSPELQKAFAQVLRNDGLRKGIAENLSRAAPALTDPKCSGVLLSVFVPPPPALANNNNKQPNPQSTNNNNKSAMSGWFQKMLNHQEEQENLKEPTERNKKNARQKRVRTMAAAAAVVEAERAKDTSKFDRNLARLEASCRTISIQTPSDPVRAKSWMAWVNRERGAVIFRQNRKVLNEELAKHGLSLQEHTGTRGAGSALRQMLSVRPIEDKMGDVIRAAIELEAAKSQRRQETPDEMHKKEEGLDVDITLSQLLVTEDGLVATEEVIDRKKKKSSASSIKYLHPSSLEAALTSVCRISSSPAGGLSVSNAPVSHRSRDEISALAQDKHERALISQVVSPQDIGVTYDMIGGLTNVKELLRQSITYPLKFPHLYSEGIAREAVKGVLLFGPPGTGKTMLAKAVATEGGASFLSVDASSVENKWLGESEKNAKAVFTLARRLAPCVIFIDEVDSLLSSREGSSDDSAHGTLTSVKTTMMSEWDGLNSGTNGAGEAGSDRVVVIGSTNRPFDLDEAVLRRFPRRILVDLPDLETRTEILEVTLAENRLDPSVNLTAIAERLEGYTGSDIKEVCREAVVQISHEQARLLDQGILQSTSREDVTEGSLQRLRPVTEEDFESALSKLKRSVAETGRELARVWEWNDQYGEIKKDRSNVLPHLASMYL